MIFEGFVALFTQSLLRQSLITFLSPKCEQSISASFPAASTKTCNCGEVCVVIWAGAIGGSPCRHEHEHVCTDLLCAEVLGVSDEGVCVERKHGEFRHQAAPSNMLC